MVSTTTSAVGTARGWATRATALVLVAALNALVGPALLGGPSPANAADPCGAGGNKIACENAKPGTDPEIWDIQGAGDSSIQGFATDISVNVGQRIDFKIATNASSYTIDIYRTGWYQGLGARYITSVTPSATLPQTQPNCITDVTTELYDCGNWAVSASWNVPSTAVSGVYVAKLTRTNGDTSHITFIVRDDSSTSSIVFQTADPTWHAYNTYGGSDFYAGGANGRAYKVSYNRPFNTRGSAAGRDFYFGAEYALVRFLERNGYDVSYIAGVDTDRRGNLLTNHKVFLSVGHDEYWSGAQRANITAARDAGVNLQFLAGNEGYWRTRYEPSADPSHTAYRTLVTYKETWANAKIDPTNQWTGTWRDPRFASRANGGGMPENELIGTGYMVNFSDLAMTVQQAEGRYRLWRNTPLATTSATQTTLAPHTVGYESNEVMDNGFSPPGLVKLSTTTGAVPQYLRDFGSTVTAGTTKHNLTLYKAPSGALVFSAGTVQWTYGLDAEHDSEYPDNVADSRMQQAQVNLLADMGAQPATLMTGLAAAAKSTDTVGPTITINTPAAGQAQKNGDLVTLTGTATDAAGRVAGVEVSNDNGATWQAAGGTTSWTATVVQKGRGTTPILVRGIDDSANIGTPASRSFSVSCPCSIFGNITPPTPDTDDNSGVELGLRFTPVVDGFATGVRFYKGTGNTGTHVGSLWSSTGQRLGQVTFANETATGWQTAQFTQAVPIIAGQTYTVSYTAPRGHYASEQWAFAYRGVDTGGMQVAGGFGATPAGVYGGGGTMPSSSYQKANYFVDLTYSATDDSPLIAMSQSPAPDSSAIPVTTTVSARFSKAMAAGTPGLTLRDSNNQPVAGSTSYDAPNRTITFTPTNQLAAYVRYTATLSGTDAQGNPITSGGTWSFTTAKPPNPPGVCPCSLFSDETVPTVMEINDGVPLSLGTRFTSDAKGIVTGVRFYKSSGNTGAHVGSLWNANGVELASGTFTNESASGWQQLNFTTPVAIAKNTPYVVSYRSTSGRYSATPNAFSERDLSWAPLRVTSTSGAYTYATGFPGGTSSTSYLVDVVFEKTPPSISMTSQSPAPGALDVPRSSKVVVDFSDLVEPGWAISVNGGGALAGSAVLSTDRQRITWTPSAPMPAGTDVTVTLTGVTTSDGASLGTRTWTFRTRDAETLQNQTLLGDVVPDTSAADDGAPIELGMAFTPSRNGTVKQIRFFKGAGNNGTHTGSIWSAAGSRLATVTFTNETAGGWQTATLATPLQVTAGTTYVVSYFAPQGHYAVTPGFFGGALTKGDLTAPSSNNGRYLYASGGGYPGYTYGAANYFVDVVFERAAASLTVDSRTPAPGADQVSLSAKPSITMSAPLATGWSVEVTRSGVPVAGTSALSADGRTITFTPAAPLVATSAYSVSVSGLASTEGATLGTQTWSFTTGIDDIGTTSLFADVTPTTAAADDTSAIELGTRFTASQAGSVTAVRFFKGTGNSGTHVGSLWDAAGNRLAQVTFTNETATGWQTAALATPVALTPGATYVVSYYAPVGRYSASPGYFATAARTVGPLTAPSGSNGVYRYGAGGGFPAGSYNSTNYFVDVVFKAASP
ncbi:hypothetical protein ASC64_04095 [Nocardioides sp. Root122]|uniref:DUF4082 domain-containing protein n=1 Tax=Nocardioides TaxID=1839 RepID=UPI0007025FBF|nr:MULTISPECIES: DUF4082 domain-containing protein [Nocardioides]KQV77995.1 hypothetical protein ASC64_04095 [Nocardioides sp. Root122]MCK9825079.1 DUF4082 domain-containing protein [Nocardioides cavernae]